MSDNIKVVDFKSKEKPENDNVVSIKYINHEHEFIDAEAFAESQELAGYIAFWKEDPYIFLGYRNSRHIQSLDVVPKSEILGEEYDS